MSAHAICAEVQNACMCHKCRITKFLHVQSVVLQISYMYTIICSN